MKFNRSIEELEKYAAMWWPETLLQENAALSIIPKLIETQKKFLSILILSQHSPEQVLSILKVSQFSANLFLKHLSVLSDYGGESIQRLNRSFSNIFPDNEMSYIWNGVSYKYVFQDLPKTGLSNTKLKIDGKGLLKDYPLTPLYEDMIMLLLHASM